MNSANNSPDWDKIKNEKRIDIIRGISVKQAWQIVAKEVNSETTKEQLNRAFKAYVRLYRKLLKQNTELLLASYGGDEND